MIVGNKMVYLAFVGEYGPAEVYIGTNKIAGWESIEQTGTDLTFDGTYNDAPNAVTIYGASSQTQTVQGKNLYDSSHVLYGYMAGGVWSPGGTNVQTGWIECEPNTTYAVSKVASARFAVAGCAKIPTEKYEEVNNVVNNYTGTSIVYTTSADDRYLLVWYYNGGYDTEITADEIRATLQVELGDTPTAYEPFVPDSPSEEYPSEITNAEEIIVTCAGESVSIPYALYGVPGESGGTSAGGWLARDTIEVSGGKVTLIRRVDAQQFDSTVSIVGNAGLVLPEPVTEDITGTATGQALLGLQTVYPQTRIYTTGSLPVEMTAKMKGREAVPDV